MLPTRTNLTGAEENTLTTAATNDVNFPKATTNAERLLIYLQVFQVQQENLHTCSAINWDYVQAFSRAFETALRAAACTFCGGRGHEQRECMTLIKFTRQARDCGFGFHFGALKGLAYYRQYLANMNI